MRPLLQRIGNAAFSAELAALLASFPAAVRLAQADAALASFPMAWALLAVIALVPMAILVPIFRAAREGLRAWAGDGLRERMVGFAVWLGAMLILMLRFGAALRAKTHHHALAGVTFALGAITIAIVLGLFAVRLVRWAAADRDRRTVVLGVMLAGVLLVLFRSIPTTLSSEARAGGIDGAAALVASIVAASKTLEAKANTGPTLARLGGLLAVVLVALALLSRAGSSASLRDLVALAPLHAALTGMLSALR